MQEIDCLFLSLPKRSILCLLSFALLQRSLCVKRNSNSISRLEIQGVVDTMISQLHLILCVRAGSMALASPKHIAFPYFAVFAAHVSRGLVPFLRRVEHIGRMKRYNSIDSLVLAVDHPCHRRYLGVRGGISCMPSRRPPRHRE